MSELKQAYTSAMMNTFGEPQMVLIHGEGAYVWDESGKKYLDLLAGIAVNALGYAHPVMLEALQTQASKLMHVSNFFATPAQISLAQKLQSICASHGYDPASVRTFFANSGTEANEAAIKISRLHKKNGRIIALTHSFHGRTCGALSVTWKEAYRAPFEPLPSNVTFVEPTIEALENAFDDDVAALFIEPIQGEAGVLPLSDELMKKARQLCDVHDALMVVDEVQTGMGRTGAWLASGDVVKADVITLAKGLGGGIPIGACLAVGKAADLFQPGNHGTTFGGNPLACAVSLAVISEVEKLLPHVNSLGRWISQQLSDVGYEVRGKGLLIGIKVHDAAKVTKELREKGFITNMTDPHTVRIAPPFIITQDDLRPFINAMREGRYAEG
ncbi:MAG: acetylornithine transaminase [Actinomycetaceae bacterium]|nr:acetylornithine transaminase [Actinomycetaceae bacterium]